MPEAAYNVNAVKCEYTPVCYQCNAEGKVYATVTPKAVADDTPVIALVADSNDTFESWFKIAHANLILDQMMAEGACKPCVLHLHPADLNVDYVGYKNVLKSGDYKTWAEARKALVEALKAF